MAAGWLGHQPLPFRQTLFETLEGGHVGLGQLQDAYAMMVIGWSARRPQNPGRQDAGDRKDNRHNSPTPEFLHGNAHREKTIVRRCQPLMPFPDQCYVDANF